MARRPSSSLAKKLFQSASNGRPGASVMSATGGGIVTRRTSGRVIKTAGGLVGFLSSKLSHLRSLPARAGEVRRECALSGRGRGDLLGRDGDGAAAFGDVLDGEHDLFGGGALLLGGDLHLAAH